jgi:heme/copper-type cytochrome/quinol oxidase subunit 2
MLRQFVTININLVSIIVFLILFAIILLIKPSIMFDKNGNPREFGIGYKNKTILPLWLAVIIIAIISYLAILCYINYKRFIF